MFDFWPVYSGEQFRASWPSCYVMGKGLSGELSCPCDRSCFLKRQVKGGGGGWGREQIFF